MSERSSLRLAVLQVLVVALLLTLLGRLWYMQVIAQETYEAQALSNSQREVVTPAVRGLILDARGRPLAQNRTTLVLTVNRQLMDDSPGEGKPVLQRLAKVIGADYQDLYDKTRRCGTDQDAVPPLCWSGSPFQPIPVAEDATSEQALRILERHEAFPGITAQLQTVRTYPQPFGANAAHELGYIGPSTQEDVGATAGSAGAVLASDLVGKAGLEAAYDDDLRGQSGVTTLSVDQAGNVLGTLKAVEPTPGNYLVTSIDSQIQKVVEDQLAAAIKRSRVEGDRNKDYDTYHADSGAAVVMDVKTGRIVAMASYPTYNPSVWVGGISRKDYKAITSKKHNYPSLSRAYQGVYAPGSTFKIVSVSAALKSGDATETGTYDCPPYLEIGDARKNNYESESFPPLTLQGALEVSCDTVFYQFAVDDWLEQGGRQAAIDAHDPFVSMAKNFGLGERTGIDLSAEAGGVIADRQWRYDYWEAIRPGACEQARSLPEGTFLQRLAVENCSDQGYVYSAGEAANFAIGQGSTGVTPLQMVRAYSAIANGGTLYRPTIGKAVISPAGTVVREIEPEVTGRLPIRDDQLRYIQQGLERVVTGEHGTARRVFEDFPIDQIPIAAKTGTAEVHGKDPTSWFASYAPANDPQYAIVMMVSQGGTGSGVSGPSVANIYKSLFGVMPDGTVDPSKALLERPAGKLPVVTSDGRVKAWSVRKMQPAWIPDLTGITGPRLFIKTSADKASSEPVDPFAPADGTSGGKGTGASGSGTGGSGKGGGDSGGSGP